MHLYSEIIFVLFRSLNITIDRSFICINPTPDLRSSGGMFNVHIVLVKTYLLVSVWVLCMGQATLSRVSAAYYQVTVAEPGSYTSITHQTCATCGGWLGLTTRGQKSKEIITTPVLLSRHWLLGCWVILCKHLRILVRGYRHHQATAAHRRTLLKDYCCTSPVVGILKISPFFWGETMILQDDG